MKKGIIIGIIIGALVSGISVYAGVSLSSDKVGYKDTNVKDSLDNLFTESVSGKNSITTALSNKGFNVNNNSTYSEIINGINELPVTIGKDESGNYGYIKEGEDTVIPFDGSVKFELVKNIMILNYSLDSQSGSKSYTFEENGIFLIITYGIYVSYASNLGNYVMKEGCTCTSSSAIVEPLNGNVYKVIANAGDTITVTTTAGSSSYLSYKGFSIYKV